MLRLLSITLLFLFLGVAVEVSAGTLEKLQIGVKQKSENCVMKSRQGDRLRCVFKFLSIAQRIQFTD